MQMYWILIPPFPGSNPAAPASHSVLSPHVGEGVENRADVRLFRRALGLRNPDLRTARPVLREFSGYIWQNSRFAESETGDRCESTGCAVRWRGKSRPVAAHASSSLAPIPKTAFSNR